MFPCTLSSSIRFNATVTCCSVSNALSLSLCMADCSISISLQGACCNAAYTDVDCRQFQQLVAHSRLRMQSQICRMRVQVFLDWLQTKTLCRRCVHYAVHKSIFVISSSTTRPEQDLASAEHTTLNRICYTGTAVHMQCIRH